MYRETEELFTQGELSDFISGRIAESVNAASNLQLEVFEANGIDQIVEHISSARDLVTLELLSDQMDYSLEECSISQEGDILDNYQTIKIPGYEIRATVPYEGTPDLFSYRPSRRLLTRFEAKLSYNPQTIQLIYSIPQQGADEASIRDLIQRRLSNIEVMVKNVNTDIGNFNEQLRRAVRDAVENRKHQIEKLNDLKSAFNIPLKKNVGATPANPIVINKSMVSPLSKQKSDPGYTITDEDYEVILNAIRNMGASMESSCAADGKDEEGMRDILLVSLNASMTSGSAGGEVFRKKGKTDIHIAFENKSAFIAECKLWKGKSYVLDGITQLLGYTTWRDAKTSIILFNKRNSDFSSIQSKVDDIFKSHENYVRNDKSREFEWRYVFSKPGDAGRLITIHAFLFDVSENENVT